MVGQGHGPAFAQHAGDGLFQRLAGLFVDDFKDGRQGPARNLLTRPAGQRCRHGIEKVDAARGIGGDYRVADAVQDNAQPLALLAEFPVGLVLEQRQLDLGRQVPFIPSIRANMTGTSATVARSASPRLTASRAAFPNKADNPPPALPAENTRFAGPRRGQRN